MASGSKKSQAGYESIYVIGGKDKFLSDAECEQLIGGLLSEEERAMSLYQVRGQEADSLDVLDELRTVPFLSARRVVVVRDADKFISENRDVLERYFDNPSGTGVLILTVQTWRKNTKLAKKLSSIGRFVEVGEVKGRQLPRYAANYAKDSFGKGMSEVTAGLVVELVGDEAGAVCREVEKLAVYVGDRKSIKAEDVEALTGHNRQFGAFAVIDSVIKGNTSEAVCRLRNMFYTDKNAEYRVVGAFAFHFRRVFRAKVMLDEGLNDNQVAGKLGIRWGIEEFFEQVSGMSLKQIGTVLRELARIDYSIKTGGSSCRVAIEQLVMRLGVVFKSAAG
jgi:DNA polymerase-3 subunit delta